MKQFTKEDTIDYHNSNQWKKLTPLEIAAMFLYHERLCVPFDVGISAISTALNRSIWVHELLDRQRFKDELTKVSVFQTFEEIIDLIQVKNYQ